MEVTTKSQKKLRADILLPFNRRHLFLGEGIFFEIQISNQNDKLTYFRSIERALHGYSTCWLFEKDFIIEEDNIQLKDKLIKLNSFSEEIHYAKSGFVSKLKEVIEEQCRFLDEKITETNLHIDKLENTKQEISNNISLKAEELYNQSASRLNSREALLLRKIEQLEGNPFQGLVDSYKKQLEERYEWFIKNTGNAFSNLVAKYTIMLRKLNYPLTLGICPKCNKGYMTKRRGQYGLFYSCSNWNKNGTGCNHIINLKEDDDGEVV